MTNVPTKHKFVVPPGREFDLMVEEYRQLNENQRMQNAILLRSVSLLVLFIAASFGVGIAGNITSDSRLLTGIQWLQPIIPFLVIVITSYVCQIAVVTFVQGKYIRWLEFSLRSEKYGKILRFHSEIMENTLYRNIISSGKPDARHVITPTRVFAVSCAFVIVMVLVFVLVNSFRLINDASGILLAGAYLVVAVASLLWTTYYLFNFVVNGLKIVEEAIASVNNDEGI